MNTKYNFMQFTKIFFLVESGTGVALYIGFRFALCLKFGLACVFASRRKIPKYPRNKRNKRENRKEHYPARTQQVKH